MQTKLAAAKASASRKASPETAASAVEKRVSTSPPLPTSRQRATTLTSASSPSLPTNAPPMPSLAPSQRAVSGPSVVSRPKSPEKKSLFTFRSRSPEKNVAASSSTPQSNKKRPPPEDYDSVARNIPAQGFAADGVKSDEGSEPTTPRVRRVFTNIQSGFTPSRHPNRPIAPLPSPRRSDGGKTVPLSRATHMTDLTNNVPMPTPQPIVAEESSKRSWLGKIRGATQAPGASRARGDRQRAQ